MSTDHDIRRLTHWKRSSYADPIRLGTEAVTCFKFLEKRHKKFGRIGEAWLQLTPPALQAASELSTFARGILGITVEGSGPLFLLKQAMQAGLQEQLLLACRGEGLKKVTLRAGRLSG